MTDKEIIVNYIINATSGIHKGLREVLILILILGTIIIVNQIRIRKQLRQIQEQLETISFDDQSANDEPK